MAAANKKPAPAARWGSPDKPLAGRRLIRTLENQLDTLRQKPCHANRDLRLDHVVVAHLLAFFNPALKSLREIEDLFQDRRLRKRFGSPRVPKSTLSDAQRVFDPQLLLPLMADLKARVKIQPHDARLDQLMRDLMAADGRKIVYVRDGDNPRVYSVGMNTRDEGGKYVKSTRATRRSGQPLPDDIIVYLNGQPAKSAASQPSEAQREEDGDDVERQPRDP